MVKQWVPYDSLGRNLDTDMEKIMLYTSPGKGISLGDIYRYLANISFIYADLYTRLVMKSKNKADVDEVFAEIYSKNDEFFSFVKNTMVDRGYVTVKKAEEIISKFEVPNIE